MGKALIFSGLQVKEPLQKVTLLQSGLITPTLSISSNNEETDTTFSFTISAENATKVSYIVKEYSEGAPSDIFSEGESITISELPKKITVSEKTPETKYIIYAGAISSDNVKVEKNISITTKEKVLVTADDYVEEYKKLATSISSEQENALKAFIGSLISDGLWSKVLHFYPLLGGINQYKYDVKDVRNQKEWNTPENGTSWDSVRNAIYTNIPGQSLGKPLELTDVDEGNYSLFISYKVHNKNKTPEWMFMKDYQRGNKRNDSFSVPICSSNGGWMCPYVQDIISPAQKNINNYRIYENTYNIYSCTLDGTNCSLYVKTGSNGVELVDTVSYAKTNNSIFSMALAGYYSQEMEAPAQQVANGCFGVILITNSSLIKDDVSKIMEHVRTFDVAVGRDSDFEE